jgi:putative membrane protein
MLGRLIIRIVINAVAVWVAATVVSRFWPEGMSVTDSVGGLLLVAVILGLVNAIIKPVLLLLTCPINVLTLGLFTLVINALLLMLTAWLSRGNLYVSGFGAAFVGALIISVVSFLLSMFLTEDK